MNRLLRHGSACVASLLIAIFLVPPTVWAAPKPLTPEAVHARIVKRGMERWVGVRQSNGVVLWGTIIAINPDSFTLQLPNDPQPVTVFYASVVALQTGAGRGFWIFTGAAIAATVGFGIWAAVHFHDEEQQHTLPPEPTPVFP
jgi:hypothetical protein